MALFVPFPFPKDCGFELDKNSDSFLQAVITDSKKAVHTESRKVNCGVQLPGFKSQCCPLSVTLDKLIHLLHFSHQKNVDHSNT